MRCATVVPLYSPAAVSFCFANFCRVSILSRSADISGRLIELMPLAYEQSELASARGAGQGFRSSGLRVHDVGLRVKGYGVMGLGVRG